MIQLPEKFLATVPLPEDEKLKLVESLNEVPPVSIRINPKKFSHALSLEKVKWCNDGYYLPQRPIFTFDPIFHSGAYYVQEASSMIIGEIVKEISKEHSIKVALDLCASPGGKTTHLLSNLPEDSFLISNEIVSARLGALDENISKWGNNNVAITCNDPAHFTQLENLFDLILVDAPCSGEGMFRKEEAALTEWSEKNVEHCSIRQKKIISDILPSLKPGGFLIYSTCTYNEKENEENIRFLIDNFDLEPVILSSEERSVSKDLTRNQKPETQNGLRFYPHTHKGEGFFVSVLRKQEKHFRPFHSFKLSTKTTNGEYKNYLLDYSTKKFTFFQDKDQIKFFPTEHFALLETLKNFLRFKKTGTILGTPMGKDIVPDHELILSYHLDKNAFPKTELSYEESIQFLSKEVPNISPDHKGWGFFTYQDFPLGWYKSVPGRINNYFPKDLKIRKKYDPSMKFSLLSL
jgi:16S rRNA C967 or C1407 C5-methylase (RsmB/RsmF family)/NOL1/NOP2/fmu family ribosome biogenesis protein